MAPHPAHHGPPAASIGRMVDPSGRCGEHLYAKSKCAGGNDTAQWTVVVRKVLHDSFWSDVKHSPWYMSSTRLLTFWGLQCGCVGPLESRVEYSIQMSTSQNCPANIEWWIVTKHTIVSEGNNLHECLWKLSVIKGWLNPIMYHYCIHPSHPPCMHPSSSIYNLKEGWMHGSKRGMLHYTLFINIDLHIFLIVNIVTVSTTWQRTNQVVNASGYFAVWQTFTVNQTHWKCSPVSGVVARNAVISLSWIHTFWLHQRATLGNAEGQYCAAQMRCEL